MGRKRLDLVGKRFGRLVVVAKAGLNKWNQQLWNCKCECGKNKIIIGNNLQKGHTKSCGCFRREKTTTHGMGFIPENWIWRSMKTRCSNENEIGYKNYGGRGIKVCNRWLKFENFFEDMGLRPSSKHTLERVDNEKGYCPENCIWDTRTNNNRNQRIRKDNKTGHKGIAWLDRIKKYTAVIGVDGKPVHIGCFTTIYDAIIAREKAELKYWGKKSNA